jgi:hypothetical protein
MYEIATAVLRRVPQRTGVGRPLANYRIGVRTPVLRATGRLPRRESTVLIPTMAPHNASSPRVARCLTNFVPLLLLLVAAVSCGGSSRTDSLSAHDVRRHLADNGWSVQDAQGMAPLAGGEELAFLTATSPDGTHVSLQVLDSSTRAQREVELASAQSPGFHGSAVRNVMVFDSAAGDGTLPNQTLSQLGQLLDR